MVASGGVSETAIDVCEVSKTFDDDLVALAPSSLSIRRGEFVAIVGPSGCGKSTLLRLIAGIMEPTAGKISMPADDTLAFVFQEPGLLPWRNALGNAELLLELNGVERQARRKTATAALQTVGLGNFVDALPHQLSGGMKMRLSLARAIAFRPSLLLMDEPLAAVDEITRDILQEEISTLCQNLRLTALLVTHNVYEALYLADRIVVMSTRPGRIIDIVEVPFAFPRTPDVRASTEFTRLAAGISASLRQGFGERM